MSKAVTAKVVAQDSGTPHQEVKWVKKPSVTDRYVRLRCR